jgi:broad specificity phosphatase PhoE
MTTTVETRWWFVRHAPVPNPEGRCYGQHDLDCDVTNAAAFASLARRLPAQPVWMATTLRRTQATMNAIHAARGTRPDPLHLERELIEQSFGEWQGRTYAELGAFGRGGDAGVSHRFWLAPAHSVPPGGESFVQVMERVATAVRRLTAAHAGHDIVCVAHGGSIRAALAMALGLDPEAALAFSIETLSLTRIDHIDGPAAGHGWRVSAVNLPPL